MEDAKPSWWTKTFRAPQSADDAIALTNELTKAFIWLGALTAVLGVFLSPGMVTDGLVAMGLAWAIKKYRSRGAAIVLAIISCLGVLTTGHAQLVGGSGGKNAVLAVIMAAYAIQTARVMFLYHRMTRSQINASNILVKSILAAVYGAVGFFFAVVVAVISRVDWRHLNGFVIQGVMMSSILGFAAAFAGVLPFTKNRPAATRELA